MRIIFLFQTDTTVVTHIQRFLHDLKEENTEVGLVHYGSAGGMIQPVINLNTLDEIPSFHNLDTENQTPEINVTDGVVNAMQVYIRPHKNKEEGKEQESIQLNTTPDTGYYMGR